MSRLRRIEQYSRLFFVTCNLRRQIAHLNEGELAVLADTLSSVRAKTVVAVCAYVLMPDHWHAILLPFETSSISGVMHRIKISSAQRIRKIRAFPAPIWQSRFYDHILRTRREFDQTLEYIHQNPVERRLVQNSLDWKWSSASWLKDRSGPLEVDEVDLPFDSYGQI
ncbi:MAG: transposase [Acidobacteriia bacterium]|nr:transposase [Terriglobia bacterium]